MKLSTYYDIIETIKNGPGLSINCAKVLIAKYPQISPNTLYSILSIEGKNQMKSKYGTMIHYAKMYSKMYKERKNERKYSGILLMLAEQTGISPALLLKHLLEKYYTDDQNVTRTQLNKILKDTTVIEDKFLAYEAFLCVLYDNHYGPIADSIGKSIGEEYELKLRNYMLQHNIAFIDEEQLRSKGYDKTPDIKLEVPIAVDGVVINWIESKARFGSVEIHNEYMNQQYCSYWNRFGPGLIIYWFDFIDTLNLRDEKRFIIMNDLPKNITHIQTNSTRISFV